MTKPQRATAVSEKWRMPLRVGAVLVAYLIYRLPGDDRLGAGLALGIGSLIVLFTAVDRSTRPRREQLELMQVGSLVLALGLISVGIMLALR